MVVSYSFYFSAKNFYLSFYLKNVHFTSWGMIIKINKVFTIIPISGSSQSQHLLIIFSLKNWFILFHWSIFLFLCKYHMVLMTVALQYSLKSGILMPPAAFFSLKTALASWGLLCFHMNCETFCSSSVKMPLVT